MTVSRRAVDMWKRKEGILRNIALVPIKGYGNYFRRDTYKTVSLLEGPKRKAAKI